MADNDHPAGDRRMNVVIFGATGMIGQGVLRQALAAEDVGRVVTVGRNKTGVVHPKLEEIVVPDMFDYSAVQDRLVGFDACLFVLGVSSAGMDEAKYTHLTYDLTLNAANVLARLNPRMTFVYVSGRSTDSTEQGKTMWARVKGRTENALQALPFKAVYLFRPGMIIAMNGETSRVPAYRWIYRLVSPLIPLLRRWYGEHLLTTESISEAMLNVVRHGGPQPVMEIADIQAAALPA